MRGVRVELQLLVHFHTPGTEALRDIKDFFLTNFLQISFKTLGRFKISLQISFPDSIHWDNGHKRPQTATSPTAPRQGSGGMSTPGLTPPAA